MRSTSFPVSGAGPGDEQQEPGAFRAGVAQSVLAVAGEDGGVSGIEFDVLVA